MKLKQNHKGEFKMIWKWFKYMVLSVIVLLVTILNRLSCFMDGFTERLTIKMARKTVKAWDELYDAVTPEMRIKMLVEHWRVHSIDDLLK